MESTIQKRDVGRNGLSFCPQERGMFFGGGGEGRSVPLLVAEDDDDIAGIRKMAEI